MAAAIMVNNSAPVLVHNIGSIEIALAKPAVPAIAAREAHPGIPADAHGHGGKPPVEERKAVPGEPATREFTIIHQIDGESISCPTLTSYQLRDLINQV